MKLPIPHLFLLAAGLVASQPVALSETGQVPQSMSYQGRLSDTVGLIDSIRGVEFRFYSSPDARFDEAGRYAEKHTVVFSDGEFSVLLGSGIRIEPNDPTGQPAGFSDIFNKGDVYLGVTVSENANAVTDEIEVSPRQQLVTTAFAFRSAAAESVVAGGTITGTDDFPVTITGPIALTGGEFTGGEFTGGTFAGGTFTGGTFTGDGAGLTGLIDGNLSSNVALLNRSPQAFTGALNTFAGKIGIGTNNPMHPLEIAGGGEQAVSVTGAGDLSMELRSAGGTEVYYEIGNQHTGNNSWKMGTNDDNKLHFSYGKIGSIDASENSNFNGVKMTILPNGNVGIGETNPTHILQISGQGRSTNQNWATSSDRRVKKDIVPLAQSLNLIERLRPVRFVFAPTYREVHPGLDGIHAGFIAQEVAEVFPTMVTQTAEVIDNQGSQLKDFNLLNTGELMPHLVASVQELRAEKDAQIDALKSRIAELEAKDAARDAKLAAIENLLLSADRAVLPTLGALVTPAE